MNKKGYQARPGFTLWTLKIVQTQFIHLAPAKQNLLVKCERGVCTYLVSVRFVSFGQTEAWCGTGVSFPAERLQPSFFLVVWDPRMTEAPSCASLHQTRPMGELFCHLWVPGPKTADFWKQCEATWTGLYLLVDNKEGASQNALEFILLSWHHPSLVLSSVFGPYWSKFIRRSDCSDFNSEFSSIHQNNLQ